MAFIHLEVPRAALQSVVPFPLDCFEGKAIVSLVPFLLARLRPAWGGTFSAWFFRPIATHPLFNVRTYVRAPEPGIYFIREWLPNRISARLGRWPYGLPYHLGRLDYDHCEEQGRFEGSAEDTGRRVDYRIQVNPRSSYAPASEGSMDAFLLERYTAYTSDRGCDRSFRVWHEPWRAAAAEVQRLDTALLTHIWPWMSDARVLCAHMSPGVRDVRLGRPYRINPRLPRSAFSELP